MCRSVRLLWQGRVTWVGILARKFCQQLTRNEQPALQHFSLEISGQIPTPVDVPRDTVVKSRGGRKLMVLIAKFRPGPTFMQGNDRSRLHLRVYKGLLIKCPWTKRGKHGLGLWLPYHVAFKSHWSLASNGSAIGVST